MVRGKLLVRHFRLDPARHLGETVVDTARAGRDLWMVYVSTLAGLIRGGRPKGEITRQMYAIGNKSLVFIIVTLGFIGMVMTYEACLQLSRVTGDYSQVGTNYIRLIVSDFGPTLTALMLATRVGAGIAAEIGSMKVTEQIDALEVFAVDPVRYLVVPRLVSAILMVPLMVALGDVVGLLGGWAIATGLKGISSQVFLTSIQTFLSLEDVLKGLEGKFPGFGERLFDDAGQLRRFVNVFVADEDIRFLNGTDTVIEAGQVVSIIPAVAGG